MDRWPVVAAEPHSAQESLARWSRRAPRQHADIIVRMGAESDVEACVRLVAAIGASEAVVWLQTLTRTVRDGSDGRCSWSRPAARLSAVAGWCARSLQEHLRRPATQVSLHRHESQGQGHIGGKCESRRSVWAQFAAGAPAECEYTSFIPRSQPRDQLRAATVAPHPRC